MQHNPLHDQLLTNRGVISQYMGDKSTAMQDYQKAISVNPDYSLAYFNAANLYFFNRQFEKVGHHTVTGDQCRGFEGGVVEAKGQCLRALGGGGGAVGNQIFKICFEHNRIIIDMFSPLVLLFDFNALLTTELCDSKSERLQVYPEHPKVSAVTAMHIVMVTTLMV